MRQVGRPWSQSTGIRDPNHGHRRAFAVGARCRGVRPTAGTAPNRKSEFPCRVAGRPRHPHKLITGPSQSVLASKASAHVDVLLLEDHGSNSRVQLLLCRHRYLVVGGLSLRVETFPLGLGCLQRRPHPVLVVLERLVLCRSDKEGPCVDEVFIAPPPGCTSDVAELVSSEFTATTGRLGSPQQSMGGLGFTTTAAGATTLQVRHIVPLHGRPLVQNSWRYVRRWSKWIPSHSPQAMSERRQSEHAIRARDPPCTSHAGVPDTDRASEPDLWVGGKEVLGSLVDSLSADLR